MEYIAIGVIFYLLWKYGASHEKKREEKRKENFENTYFQEYKTSDGASELYDKEKKRNDAEAFRHNAGKTIGKAVFLNRDSIVKFITEMIKNM